MALMPMPPMSSLNLVVPRADQIHHALGADFGIEALREVGTLRGDAPIALAARARLALVAAQGDKRGACAVYGVGAQGNSAHDVGRIANGTGGHQAHAATNALVAKALVNARKRKLNGNAHVIARTGRRCTRAAAEAVDDDHVGARAGHATRDGGHVVNGGHFHRDGLGGARRFLQAENELTQVFDGIDVMVRRGANGVGALRNHAGAGHFVVDFLARKVSADAGLCALADFDFDHRRGFEVVHIHAETARRYLHDSVIAIFLEIFYAGRLRRS